MIKNIFQVGTPLKPNNPSNVPRPEKKCLKKYIKNREFSYLINSRQAGKTTFKNAIINELEQEGFYCIDISLQSIGGTESQSDFYNSLIDTFLPRTVLAETELIKFRGNQFGLTPNRILTNFISEQLLNLVPDKNIVIFIDEIDELIPLSFSNDFLALIRSFYDTTHTNKDYERLTFCMIGVVILDELIKDKNKSPFNIGKYIELNPFGLEAIEILSTGFEELNFHPQKTLEQILYWTGGQPFLTQQICFLLVETYIQDNKENIEIPEGQEEIIIKDFVYSQIIEHYLATRSADNDFCQHFTNIANRQLLAQKENDPIYTGRLLKICIKILEEENGYKLNDTEQDLKLKHRLKLSGLVIEKARKLKYANPIYEKIFNIRWLNEELQKLCPYEYIKKKEAWEKSGKHIYLLYGTELKEAITREYVVLHRKYVRDSDTEYNIKLRKISEIFNEKLGLNFHYNENNEYLEKITNDLLDNVNNDPTLFKGLIKHFKNLNNSETNLIKELKSVIQSILPIQNQVKINHQYSNFCFYIYKNWDKFDFLNKIDREINNLEEENRFDILVIYGNILNNNPIRLHPESKIYQQILEIGLVTNLEYEEKLEYLKVKNLLYQRIFNKQYIESQLSNLDNYYKKLGMWLIFQEDRYLLSQDELDKALKNINPSLKREEHRFLIRSQIEIQR